MDPVYEAACKLLACTTMEESVAAMAELRVALGPAYESVILAHQDQLDAARIEREFGPIR